MAYRRVYSRPVDKTTGLICDQSIKLTGAKSKKKYPNYLLRVKYRDIESGKVYEFLSNNFDLPALTIAKLYKERWGIEIFFRWIKQNLRIKSFY
jgi:IS4 transposase